MHKTTEIYLAKPRGQKEGPFTLDQINLALEARKYRGGDYWAWHKGLPEWVPLYDISGVINVSSLAANLATETPGPTRDSVKSSDEPKQNEPRLSAGEPEAVLVTREPPPICPPAELPNSDPQNSTSADSPSEDTAKTAEEVPEAAPFEIEKAETPELANSGIEDSTPTDLKPEDASEIVDETAETAPPLTEKTDEQLGKTDEHIEVHAAPEEADRQDPGESLSADETAQILREEADAPLGTDEQLAETDEPVGAEAEPNESTQAAGPSPEEADPQEAVEPLATEEAPQLAKAEANELVDKAETAASILARLKQSFLQRTEPTNGVTSYFNARRAPLPGVAETGTPHLGTEWGMPEASHPLDFHSKAVPKVPEEGLPTGPETEPAAALLAQQFSSGMPFGALEQLFIFTTGDGRSIWSSQVMARMLEAIIGEKVERIRQGTPRDVIFNCDLSQLLKRDGAISDAVWHAMAIREPSVVERAQKKLSRTCVRTFNLEKDTVVALVLFYNNQKLENSSTVLGSASPGTTRFVLPVNARSQGSPHPQ